jgi:hypothetical protein
MPPPGFRTASAHAPAWRGGFATRVHHKTQAHGQRVIERDLTSAFLFLKVYLKEPLQFLGLFPALRTLATDIYYNGGASFDQIAANTSSLYRFDDQLIY